MKILILGSKGMLGSMADLYFSASHEVVSFNKRISEANLESSMHEICSFNADLVINCIGLIKQKSSSFNDLLFVNSILPHFIGQKVSASSLFIQPSTDCVFKGDIRDHYHENSTRDASDYYGISKIYGEFSAMQHSNSLVMRGSIIGISPTSGKGLLDWFLAQDDGAQIKGYQNHHWNGITTLEWCKLLDYIINNGLYRNTKLIQFGVPDPVSKYELLLLCNKIFKKNIKIEPCNDSIQVNRTLLSSADIKYSSYISQLTELKNFLNF